MVREATQTWWEPKHGERDSTNMVREIAQTCWQPKHDNRGSTNSMLAERELLLIHDMHMAQYLIMFSWYFIDKLTRKIVTANLSKKQIDLMWNGLLIPFVTVVTNLLFPSPSILAAWVDVYLPKSLFMYTVLLKAIFCSLELLLLLVSCVVAYFAPLTVSVVLSWLSLLWEYCWIYSVLCLIVHFQFRFRITVSNQIMLVEHSYPILHVCGGQAKPQLYWVLWTRGAIIILSPPLLGLCSIHGTRKPWHTNGHKNWQFVALLIISIPSLMVGTIELRQWLMPIQCKSLIVYDYRLPYSDRH